MTLWRLRSRAASAARTATVLPAPTSPVITPMRRSATHQPMRATASLWALWRCKMAGDLPASAGSSEGGVIDAAGQFGRVRGLDQLRVVDAAGLRWRGGGFGFGLGMA